MDDLLRRWHTTRFDAILAVALTVAGLVQVLAFPIAARGLGELVVVGSTLPLAFRRTHPVEAAVVSSAFWLVPLEGYPVLGFVTAVLIFAALGMYGSPRLAVVLATAWGCATGVVGTLLGPEPPVAAVGSVIVVVAPVLTGLVIAELRRQRDALHAMARELEQERQRVQEAAVGAERARIAQELHDVVGHELTLIAIQAEAASAALRVAPERATAPVEAIRETAHRTLAEIRGTLDVLAPDRDPAAASTSGLDEVVDRARSAGVAVDFSVTGAPWPGQASVWLAVNRIVREALTNAGRHAPGQPVELRVAWTPESVTITARNPVAARPKLEPGRGLTGMRHRAELLGGTFATSVEQGRFTVRIELPHGREPVGAGRPAR